MKGSLLKLITKAPAPTKAIVFVTVLLAIVIGVAAIVTFASGSFLITSGHSWNHTYSVTPRAKYQFCVKWHVSKSPLKASISAFGQAFGVNQSGTGGQTTCLGGSTSSSSAAVSIKVTSGTMSVDSVSLTRR